MIVYISGLYTTGNIDANITAARKAAIQVWERGHVALTPHLNTAHFELDCKCTYEEYIVGDLALLEVCDAILMLEHWQESSGAKKEHAKALELEMPVYYHPDLPEEITDPIMRHQRGIVRPQRYQCATCHRSDVRLYRPYMEFLRDEQVRCKIHFLPGREAYYVPLVEDEHGDVWGYTAIPDRDLQHWKRLPDAEGQL